MAKRTPKQDPKAEALRQRGSLHPRPEAVRDAAFAAGGFFDPRDLVQVKYEMLRLVRVDQASVTEAATRFALSRPTYYGAQVHYEREGVAGLLPKKRGPRGPHKLTPEVLDFARAELAEHPSLTAGQLASRIETRFGVRVHPRSVQRGLSRREKGGG